MHSASSRFLTATFGLIVCGCGGGGGGGSGDSGSGGTPVTVACSTTPTASNQLPICIDSGPPGTGAVINIPYVSVKVCAPNSTTACQVVDHVHLDTGSSGLRLLKNAIGSLALPAVTVGGLQVGECMQFADGYTWGTVRTADVLLSGETASSVSIQIIGDLPNNTATAPSSGCNTTGPNISENSVSQLGANGILGIGVAAADCSYNDTTCVSTTPGLSPNSPYYACAGSTCTGTTVLAAQVVPNPVAAFATDNQGTLITFPALGDAGATTFAGSLVFGINSRSNNQIGSAQLYFTDSSGNIRTDYKGATGILSFIDSGSNGLFFRDASIPNCARSTSFYCPNSTLQLTATNRSGSGMTSGPVSFSIVNVDSRNASVTAANVGGGGVVMNGVTYFDWGLPFFFGKSVFTAIEAPGPGPYWAY